MKRLMLLILLVSPVWLMSQGNGTISFDFGKKKNKQASDSTQQKPAVSKKDTTGKLVNGQKILDTLSRIVHTKETYDYRKDGIFFGLFHAGINACQIDGDNEWGYTYIGAEAGIGALARFHKIFSVSLELNYTMKGARIGLARTPDNGNKYMVQWDYVEAPVALNAHYKRLFIISLGVAPAYMVRYKEIDYDGINITNDPNRLGEPRKIDICGFAGIHFIIKKNYSIGFKFSYSMLKIREALPDTRVNGEYNNYLTLRFMYILGSVKKKKE